MTERVILGPVPCHDCGSLLEYGYSGNSRDVSPRWRNASDDLWHRIHSCVGSRARARGYNTVVGVSDDSATMRNDAASGAYSTGGRVVAYPRGVRP